MDNFKADFGLALKAEFYRRNTLVVVKGLIGKALVRVMPDGEVLAAEIVEAEAYRADGDLSCHAATGRTQRNAPLFENGGIIYVYKIYGFHHCVNIVTEDDRIGSGVLLRAAEPLSGIETMKSNRKTDKIAGLCKGPGNLARAFGFTLEDKFRPVTAPDLFVQEYREIPGSDIASGPRIGVSRSAELPYRFFLRGNPYVSGKNY